MKKVICLITCIILLVALTSCGTKLPKGEASLIDCGSGFYIKNATFEYVNESTVKVIDEDGKVYYFPDHQIEYILVK